MKVVIREYLKLDNIEFRCFIHNKKLRAISSEEKISNIEEIENVISKITHYMEYDDYCVDFTYYNGKLMLIEINTPVYLFATSGLFDLTNPYDYEILLGKIVPEINYPILRFSENEF